MCSWDCFTLLSMMFSGLIHVIMYQYFNPLYDWIIFHCLDRPHQSMDVWVVSTIWWLWKKCHSEHFTDKILWECVFIFLGCIPGVEFLGHMITLCLKLWGTAPWFPKWPCQVTVPPAVLICPHPPQHLFLSAFLFITVYSESEKVSLCG
jgi:hypothetical protein